MKEFTYTITDPVGIHARPAGELVKTIKGLTSTVTITNAAGKSAAGSKLMALMGLGIKKDETITVKLEGAAEETEAAALETYFKEHL
ncbi:MAG: HPr family phosphocarrier protein, partial [Synergistes sp.]|nr:HPr family phosphocarrier protein [Synergistes sp.]